MELTIDQALQKGIEAHKAGKMQEADRYYTAILKANPTHPDANHNLGVLAVSVNKAEAALPLFKAALEANPKAEQYWLSYIDALIKVRQFDNAKQVIEQAKSKGINIDGSDQIQKMLGLSNPPVPQGLDVHDVPHKQLQPVINLYTQGQFEKALNKASQLLEKYSSSAALYNIIGATKRRLGWLEEAVGAFNQAISIQHDYAEAFYNLGNALRDQGKLQEATSAFKNALAIKPDYAMAYNNLGNCFKDQDKLEQAVGAFNSALAIKPEFALGHYNLGNMFKHQGKIAEAKEAYKNALVIKQDYGSARYMLSSLTGDTPKTAPRDYVESLFDQYANKFETSLLANLEYEVPKLIGDTLIKLNSRRSLGSVLDLGCGTGLLGAQIHNYCANLEGIDLSKNMLTIAQRKNVYDNLAQTDIVEYLSCRNLAFDYFIALDVFIYLGDLNEIFRLIKFRNKKNGRLVFSTEHTEIDGYHLLTTGRYSHSKSYIDYICQKFGCKITHFYNINLRKEKNAFLTGGIYIVDF